MHACDLHLLNPSNLPSPPTLQLMLADIWRWRRRGGGMEDEEGMRPAALALASIQNARPEDIERITSSLVSACMHVTAWWMHGCMHASVRLCAYGGWGSIL